MVCYTIIIPHYGIPLLLKRCLTSIPNRADVQVIVIDDCSCEAEQVELKKMEVQFHNVQFVYSNENKGGGHARNVGLQYAKGKYVLFADADDFYHDSLNALLDDYKNERCDIVYFNADAVDSLTLQHTFRADRLQTYINSTNKSALRFLFPGPTCKMVRKELIDKYQVKFDELKAINDVTFSYLVGYYAKDVRVDRRIIYCITSRPDSISFTDSFEKDLIDVEVLARKNQFLKEHQIPVFDEDMLNPIRKGLKNGEWHHLKVYFNVTRRYGYSFFSILFQIGLKSIKCRIRNYLLLSHKY